MPQADQRQGPARARCPARRGRRRRRTPRRSGRGRGPSWRVRPVRVLVALAVAAVDLGPVEADQRASPRSARKKPSGSNHGSRIRRRRSSTVQEPCSGWSRKAARVEPRPRPRRPGPARTCAPSRRPGSSAAGSAAYSERRICHSARDCGTPSTRPARPPPGAPPCAHSRSRPSGVSARMAPTSGRPRPGPRWSGWTTSSALAPCHLVGDVEVAVAGQVAAGPGEHVADPLVPAVPQVQHHVLGQRPYAVGLGRGLDQRG